MDVSDYIKSVPNKDAEGADLLNAICVPTLQNVSDYVEILDSEMGGLKVVRIPKGYRAIAFSGVGLDYDNPKYHTASLVNNLAWIAAEAGVKPIVLADVVDTNTGNIDLVTRIGRTLAERADYHRFGIINGENAILGPIVNPDVEANVMGTLLCMYEERKMDLVLSRLHALNVEFFDFDPEGKAIYLNCDGIGTKPELHIRAGRPERGLFDSLAMKVDDSIKVGAEVIAVFDMLEHRGELPIERFLAMANGVSDMMGFPFHVIPHRAEDRWQGYSKDAPHYNLSGTAICLIDEERLRNPLKPSAGEFLMAVRGNPTIRSNGVSAWRRAAVSRYGEDYHLTEEGQKALEFLSEPSTVFYPFFKELIDHGVASSVFHMSGGSFRSKLAKPLAKHGLYVEIPNPYPPHEVELELGGDTPPYSAYQMWPMGNEGFITTSDVDNAMIIAHNYCLELKGAWPLQRARGFRTGVNITAYNGEDVYYSGRK